MNCIYFIFSLIESIRIQLTLVTMQAKQLKTRLDDLKLFTVSKNLKNGVVYGNRPVRKRQGSLEPLQNNYNNYCKTRPVCYSAKRRRCSVPICGSEHRKKWIKLLYNYALETSFHGPKFFVEDQPFKARRLVTLISEIT